MTKPLPKEIETKTQEWLSEAFDKETQQEVQKLLEGNSAAVIDAFYTMVAFGTGGMRSVMGVGTNRVNRYTIRFATQGLANYILNQETPYPKVFIGYDSRHYSREFAKETARVLAGNKIKVFIAKDLRPTPFVSFGCRRHECTAAVMITASHNPPEYNGYKVYWSDGAQVVPPHDAGIMAEVEKITHPNSVKLASFEDDLIHKVGKEDDEAYFEALTPLQNYPETNQKEGNSLHIIYSLCMAVVVRPFQKRSKGGDLQTSPLLKHKNFPMETFLLLILQTLSKKKPCSSESTNF